MAKVNRTVLHDSVPTFQEFSTGGVVRTKNDLFKNEDGLWEWRGTFPKTVPADSTPESTGGIWSDTNLNGLWASVSDASLRGEISSKSGAALVRTESGMTLQDYIDYLSKKKMQKRSECYKKVIAVYPRAFPDYYSIIAEGNYKQLVPQGIAVDERRGLLFSLMWAEKNAGVSDNYLWVSIYKIKSSEYVSCFKLENDVNGVFPEGGFIRYSGDQTLLYTETNGSIQCYNITNLPDNKEFAVKQGDLLIEAGIFESFGAGNEGVCVFRKHFNHDVVSFFDWNGNIKTTTMLKSSLVKYFGTETLEQKSKTKIQGRTLSNGLLYMSGGAQWWINSAESKPLRGLTRMSFNIDGSVQSIQTYDPVKYTSLLIPDIDSSAITAVEYEGMTTGESGKVYSQFYYQTTDPSTLTVVLVEEDSIEHDSIDMSSSMYSMTSGEYDLSSKVIQTSLSNINNPYSNARMTTCDEVCEMLRKTESTIANVYVTSEFYIDIDKKHAIPQSTLIRFSRVSGDTVFMSFMSPKSFFTVTSTKSGQYTFSTASEGLSEKNSWNSSDFAIVGYNGLGVVCTNRSTEETAVHARFMNPLGLAGTITTSGKETRYNTTSDENLKIDFGKIQNPLSTVNEIASSGAVALAKFKDSDDEPSPMFMAQRLNKYIPSAVTPGFKDGDEIISWSVDYSKTVPILFGAIHQLSELVNDIEKKQTMITHNKSSSTKIGTQK